MSKFWDRLSDAHENMDIESPRLVRSMIAHRYFTLDRFENQTMLGWMYDKLKNLGVVMIPEPDIESVGFERLHRDGRWLSQDSMNSSFEVNAVEKVLALVDSVCEIGAGYGRTAYAILKHMPHIRYNIIDVDPALTISSTFLSKHLPEASITYSKPSSEPDPADLCIAISVFSELTPDEVNRYFSLMQRGQFVYIRDWKSYYNQDDDVKFDVANLPIPNTWERMFMEDDPIVEGFFHALWQVK